MLYLVAFLSALIAYLIGSISGAIIVSKRLTGEDIREKGSKNAGTTNMLRVHGKKLAVITLLIDILKGIIAVLIGIIIDYILSREYLAMSYIKPWYSGWIIGGVKYICGLFAMIGHIFPVYFGFRGGKGVATSIGIAFIFDWKIGLIILVLALLIMAISRYVSLGSVIGAVVYPCTVLAFMLGKGEFNATYFIVSLLIGFIIIIKHKSNIKRLIRGEENKLSLKK